MVWTVAGLYLSAIVLLHLPAVQGFLARKAAGAAGRKLGTEVRVGRIDLGVFNRFVLDDVLIYDQQKKRMLSASRIGAKVDLWHLLRTGEIDISSAQVFGLKADFYKTDRNARPNFQFALDSLASKDTTAHTPLHLSINSLVIRHGSIRYDRLDAPRTPGRLNADHISVSGISAYLVLHELKDTSLWADLRTLAFREAAGLEVRQLTFGLKAGRRHASLCDFRLETPASSITLKELSADYRMRGKRLDDGTLRYAVKGFRASVTPADFAPLLPALKTFTETYDAALEARGTRRSLRVKRLYLADRSLSTLIRAKGRVRLRGTVPAWDCSFTPLRISGNTLRRIAQAARKPLPGPLDGLGNIFYHGSFAHNAGRYTAEGQFRTGAGSVRLAAGIHGKNFRATVHTGGFDLAKVLGNSDFGSISTDIRVEGNTDLSSILAKGDVRSFCYKGYTYRNIRLDGACRNDAFSGKASIDDPNGKLSVDGKAAGILAFLHRRGKLSADLTVDARAVNLHRLHLTDALGDRTLSFSSSVKGQGTSLDDLSGSLAVSGFAMTGEGQDIRLGRLEARASSGLLGRSLDARTDFGELHLAGQYDYATLPQSIVRVLGHYLPSLVYPHPQYSIAKGKADYAFSLQLDDTRMLNSLFRTPVETARPVRIDGRVDERHNGLNLHVEAPGIDCAGQHIRHLLLNVSSRPQGLLADISAERKGGSGPHVVLNAQGHIAENSVASDIAFRIPGESPVHGNISSTASFARRRGGLETRLHFNPSTIHFDSVALQVQPSDLSYHRNSLTIDHFELSNRNQHIIANGQTSGNPGDSILVRFREIDVPYILNLVNFHSVSFAGTATGTAAVRSFFHHPQMEARLEVNGFQFEEGDMGTLHANVGYNGREGRVNIDAHADDGDARTDIKGYVDLRNSYINLPIYAHDTHLYFLRSFCGSFMDQIQARANGWCKVVGPLSNVNLEGDMEARGSIFVKPTGTVYALHDARIRMVPNEIIFGRDTVADPQGHIGIVTGGLHHNSLRHLTYDINIEAQNLLAYNHPKKQDKESFWGIVYGTGNCRIKGGPGETTMNIDLTPEKNTSLTYNAASAGDTGPSNFIRWVGLPEDSTGLQAAAAADTAGHTARTTARQAIVIPGYDDIPSDLHMNFVLHTNPNLTLGVLLDETTGDNIRLNGSGIIRATYYNKGAFQLFGNYSVSYGQYNLTIQDIIRKQFIFQPGSTIAFGGDPFNAALNLKASYIINSVPLGDLGLGSSFSGNNTKVNCLLNIEGTPGAPTVTFGLDLPSLSPDAQQMVRSVLNSEQELNQQVLYLLAVGRFYPQTNNNSTAQKNEEHSGTALAMQSLLSGTLSQQINTVLSNVVKDNNWNFGANIATGNEGFDNAEYEGMLSGSMLNNRLLFNGQFGYRNNVAKDKGSFIGDFDIRYLLFPSGNVAFRVYNQTNDRYFTRNSLTTQGIGLILKKDFNNLGDIFGHRKKKTKKAPQKR